MSFTISERKSLLTRYYEMHNVTDYPKTKSGEPNLNWCQNQNTLNIILINKVRSKNKKENPKIKDDVFFGNYRDEIINLDQHCETMNGLAKEPDFNPREMQN